MNDDLSTSLNTFRDKFETEIGFFRYQIQNNLKYVSEFERYIEKNQEIIEKEPEIIEKAFVSFHSYFPYIINNSLLITFTSYFDYKFYLLVELISNYKLGSFEIGKANGTYINKCFDYLDSKLNIKISKENSDWGLIKSINNIRNLIVHNNSSLIDGYSDKLDIENLNKIKDHKDYNNIILLKEFFDIDELTGKFYIIDELLFTNYLDSIERFVNENIIKIAQNRISTKQI